MRYYVGKGLEDYLSSLNRLMDTKYLKGAIYPAAGIVAEEVKKNIENLPICKPGGEHGVTKKQKKGLLEGFGIAPFRKENGYVHVKLGFDGYNDQYSDYYPSGQPNALIARSIEGGTSWSDPIPFIDPAVKATEAHAEAVMKANVDYSIYQIMKGETTENDWFGVKDL